jgi:hypothetical protein
MVLGGNPREGGRLLAVEVPPVVSGIRQFVFGKSPIEQMRIQAAIAMLGIQSCQDLVAET